MAFDWDVSSPGDSDVVSQFPANERSFRTASRGAFNVDHDADGTGYHNKVTLNAVSAPTGTSGKWTGWFETGAAMPYGRSGTSAVLRNIHMPSGTKLLFPQTAPPTGWTLDTDVDDVVIRVDGAAGGTSGGAWTISGLTHAHTHGPGTLGGTTSGPNNVSPTNFVQAGSSGFIYNTHSHNFSVTTGVSAAASTSAVSSDGAWRPAYLDVCKGTLD